jgi:outer membrane protein insertion porin family
MGYTDVSCRARRNENIDDHTVGIDFIIEEGQKYFVRDVVIVGNTDTKEKVIRRELAIQPGDPVDKNRIEISRQRLLGMGYFTNVEATPVNADAADEKDVHFRVEEKPTRYSFRIGAGASDVNSVFGMAEISTENFDIANPKNLFYGGGQRFRLQGIYGVENAGFNLDFVEPWLFDLPIRFELSGYMNLAEYDDWDEWHMGGRTSLQRKIFDDFTTVAVGYKFEVVRVKSIKSNLQSYFDENNLSGTFRVSQPSVMIARDTRDSMMNPTEGYQVNLFASITPKALGSSSDYYKLEGKGSYYTSFFDKAVILMLGVKLGTVSAFNSNDVNDVPVFERYYLGGSDSLRGFEYRTVSPTHNGEAIGGQTMLVMTAEVSHPIWGPIRGAAFIDAGNAWAKPWDMNFKDINIGAGYGLRIQLPWINVPIKLDIAYPALNNTDCEPDKFRIHFNVGFTF